MGRVTASWRATLRLTSREIRRTPGASVLITLLIALPAFAAVALATVHASSTPTAQTLVRDALGHSGQAQVWSALCQGVRQDPVTVLDGSGTI